MTVQDPTGRERRDARASAGSIGGYMGFAFGLMAVLSMMSEASAPPALQSGATVIVSMLVGYALGWLLQPVLERVFAQQ
jgi:hypothetical protein